MLEPSPHEECCDCRDCAPTRYPKDETPEQMAERIGKETAEHQLRAGLTRPFRDYVPR